MEISDGFFYKYKPLDRGEIDDKFNLEDTIKDLKRDAAAIQDKNILKAAAEFRKLRVPREKTSRGEVKGSWHEDVFIPDDRFIPRLFNEEKLSIKEIRNHLREKYGIDFVGIPYRDGEADFRSISIAHVTIEELIMALDGIDREKLESLTGETKAELLNQYFGNPAQREAHFKLADQIAAKNRLPICGLSEGYTADDLKKYREQNKLSWDEQIRYGYNLVPACIHGNFSHTGLVAASCSAVGSINRACEYAWEDENVPISQTEYRIYEKRKRKKGDGYMPKMPHHTIDRPIIDKKELSLQEIDHLIKDDLSSMKKLEELGNQKNNNIQKLQQQIDKINASHIASEDKQEMIDDLTVQITRQRCEYKLQVEEPMEALRKNIEDYQNLLEQRKKELEHHKNNLDKVSLDGTDASTNNAAEIARKKIEEFQKVKEARAAELNLQLGAATRQQREMRQNSLTGWDPDKYK